MSWFDATGFATLAISALKEAQKTIDKALDIKEEEQKAQKKSTDETADFFTTWGLKNEENNQQETSSNQKVQSNSSVWGSFTGSFFESPKLDANEKHGESSKNVKHSCSLENKSIKKQHEGKITSSLSLPEGFMGKKSIEEEKEVRSNSTSKEIAEVLKSNEDCEVYNENANDNLIEGLSDQPEIVNKSQSFEEDITKQTNYESIDKTDNNLPRITESLIKSSSEGDIQIDNKSNYSHDYTDSNNKLLNIAKDSMYLFPTDNKKSFESVETLGSRSNTDCTTTPESDINSVSDCTSPSTMGPKLNSESVEILPDSLVTSPSSVEILNSDSGSYMSPVEGKQSESLNVIGRNELITPSIEEKKIIHQKDSDEIQPSSSDISPYESPMEEVKLSNYQSINETTTSTSSQIQTKDSLAPDVSKISPESVEVIPDVDELDEISIAEDSYTSASEITVMTIMETFQHTDQNKNKPEHSDINVKIHDSTSENRLILSKSNNETQMNLSSDSLKDKPNFHLPIGPITVQPIRKSDFIESSMNISEPHLFDKFSGTIELPDPELYSEKEREQKIDNYEGTDQYLMLTDSSCEGTLIESSSEDNTTLVCTAEPKIVDTPLTTSSYVKNMLADAMVEKSELIDVERQVNEVPRETSPISSESRSDLVKIGSDQTSGHTSGDELETTTSSDIEIISSPNGDSSSTQSRQSPAKLHQTKSADLLTKTLKIRGHSRELSEISIGSDDTNLEIEKLLKRIQEMTEILEARESKLIDVSRMNMELNEQNNSLKKQLDSIEKHAEQNQNLTQITDEYTQRLSALEKKFQQAIRERDSMRKNLEQLKLEAASRLSSQEISTINAEKDEIIKELREEGEKLSKQQLQHSNIIKKLRLKEKENDNMIKNQKDQIEELNSELERLKRSLYAKEEVERSQIEAVHTLTAKTKKQEKEILSLQENLDNALHKMEAYKRSLDAAKSELSETKKCLITAEEELKQAISNAGESCQLSAQVQDLKIKIRQNEEAHVKREEALKQENTELLKMLEAAEARSEQLSESVSQSTKPLLRQLEQLQANLLHKTNNFMKQEKQLSEKNMDLQTKLENLIEVDRALKTENVDLKSKLSQLEVKCNTKETERQKLQEMCVKIETENEKLIEDNKRYQQIIETLEQTHNNQVKELKREINSLENKLAIEKAATDAEKRKNIAILEQQQSIDEEIRLSPTLSIGRDSISSIGSVWPAFNESTFDNNSGRFPPMYESLRGSGSSTSTLENLQAQLKQRDGEIQQLQWELSRKNIEKDVLNTELSTLTLKIEELNTKIAEIQTINNNLSEIQTRYDALLQMYGEKVEENQELRLDLEDVKEMYKTQIDQLMKKDT